MILIESWARLAALLLAVLVVSPACGQGVHPKSGRRIAPVMGVGGADWLEREEREREESPSKAIELLDLKPGMVVADIGAGVGYYTIRMAKKVGPGGKVYASDIQPEMLALLRKRLESSGVNNVEMVLATETDPKLPLASIDLAIMVDVYHELAQPQRMLRKLRQTLKDDGRLVLLEFRKEDPYVPIRPEHKMSVAEAKLELEDEGFQLEKVIPGLPWQHILVFRKSPKP
ncbi:MAG: methyltransferase domain-containing protein [Bryobacteraceae bacterium]|nr:methyltransferase domain-containing protein [Bryobacteraceae bacterium]